MRDHVHELGVSERVFEDLIGTAYEQLNTLEQVHEYARARPSTRVQNPSNRRDNKIHETNSCKARNEIHGKQVMRFVQDVTLKSCKVSNKICANR